MILYTSFCNARQNENKYVRQSITVANKFVLRIDGCFLILSFFLYFLFFFIFLPIEKFLIASILSRQRTEDLRDLSQCGETLFRRERQTLTWASHIKDGRDTVCTSTVRSRYDRVDMRPRFRERFTTNRRIFPKRRSITRGTIRAAFSQAEYSEQPVSIKRRKERRNSLAALEIKLDRVSFVPFVPFFFGFTIRIHDRAYVCETRLAVTSLFTYSVERKTWLSRILRPSKGSLATGYTWLYIMHEQFRSHYSFFLSRNKCTSRNERYVMLTTADFLSRPHACAHRQPRVWQDFDSLRYAANNADSGVRNISIKNPIPRFIKYGMPVTM